MSQVASPAVGCHLRLVEVQVGDEVETYNATTFDQPLDFSLQGQRSLGSELGTLLLVISTGSKQMLSLRLNDLLNHPYGTEEIIAIDKQAQKVCVRLPNLDHTLRVWFQHSRDFLVSVCILRKTGFTIEERPSSPLVKTSRRRLDKDFKPEPPTKLADPPSLSTITSPAARPKRAKESPAPCSTSNAEATAPQRNIFDEVLERLNQTEKIPETVSRKGSSISAGPEGSAGALLLNSYHASAPKRKSTTDQPMLDSSLQGHSSHENLDNKPTSEALNKHLPGAAMDPPPPRRHHGYFTRSFSLAAGRPGTSVNKEEHSHSRTRRGVGKRSTQNACIESPQDKARSSFGTNQTVDFRNLMPRRRSLPFLETKHHSHKRTRKKEKGNPGFQRTPIYASNVSEKMQTSCAQPICSTWEILMLLMDASTLDELETRSSPLYKQYEQDIADGHDDEKRAAFYLDSLKILRTSFWLEKLQKVSGSEHEAWAG
ncbi:hypothetical protein E4U55_002949 [Claviceps digitariae]|nr:hypothetical protein E4U55_002949 [Claviceps digitariae]